MELDKFYEIILDRNKGMNTKEDMRKARELVDKLDKNYLIKAREDLKHWLIILNNNDSFSLWIGWINFMLGMRIKDGDGINVC